MKLKFIIKGIKRTFLLIIGATILFLSVINVIGVRADLVAGITGNKIKQVKQNMTLEQVVSILGRPYEISALYSIHKINCKHPKLWLDMKINKQTNIRGKIEKIFNDTGYCCEGYREDLQNKHFTMTYTRPVNVSKCYPMLWVHLDSNYRVSNVFAKQYDGFLGFDDQCIYNDGVIDEKEFNKCFK